MTRGSQQIRVSSSLAGASYIWEINATFQLLHFYFFIYIFYLFFLSWSSKLFQKLFCLFIVFLRLRLTDKKYNWAVKYTEIWIINTSIVMKENFCSVEHCHYHCYYFFYRIRFSSQRIFQYTKLTQKNNLLQ